MTNTPTEISGTIQYRKLRGRKFTFICGGPTLTSAREMIIQVPGLVAYWFPHDGGAPVQLTHLDNPQSATKYVKE